VEYTGCDGVVVGRGCLGRPWLFAELQAAFQHAPAPAPPRLGEVCAVLRRHAELLAEHHGTDKGLRDLRKHMSWYLHGFPSGGEVRRMLGMVSSFTELDQALAQLDPDAPFPASGDGPRGRQGSPGRVVLPQGWLADPMDLTVPAGAELPHSGG
ncbi:MAG: tRNA-dihydrouridine synthase, partial [Pseudonocardiaceae bacterium]